MPPALPESDSELEPEHIAIRDKLKGDSDSEMEEDAKSAEETPEADIQPRGGRKNAKKVEKPAEPESEEEDDDDDDEIDPDEFVVEAIKDHIMTKGILSFLVKWEGYEKKADMTWEPEDSLREGADKILDEYLETQGGRDAIIEQSKAKGKKRARKSNASEAPAKAAAPATKRSRKNAQHPADGTPPATANQQWSPPLGSWEDEIDEIATEPDPNGKLIVYLTWKNGKKTKHDTAVVYKKCPQRMLKFYEQHVRIVTHGE